MTMPSPLSLLRLPLLALFLASSSVSASNVIELDSSNFEHETQASTGQTTGNWFVKFVASWCGHCKKLAPVWEELSETLTNGEEPSGIIVASVDAVANRDLSHRFDVKGFPTLIFFADRKMYRYKGARTVEKMKEFVTGGYQSAEAMTVPPPETWIGALRRQLFDALARDFDHIIAKRKNAAAVLLLIGFVFGIIFMAILNLLFGGSSTKETAKAKVE